MVKIYYRKIKEVQMNPSTGEAWKIEDVPELWREDVRKLLSGETNIGY